MQMLVAAALGLAAVCLLYFAWRDLVSGQWPVVGGWLLWLVSGVFWVRATGPEFGAAIVLTAPALVAWALVWSMARRRQLRHLRQPRQRQQARVTAVMPHGRWRSFARHVSLFFVAVPLSFVAGALVSVGFTRQLPLSDVNAMVLAAFLTPVSWGAAAWWASATDHRLRAATGIVVAALLGAAAAWL